MNKANKARNQKQDYMDERKAMGLAHVYSTGRVDEVAGAERGALCDAA